MYNLLKKDFGNGKIQYIYYKKPVGHFFDDDDFPYERFDILDLEDEEDRNIQKIIDKQAEKRRLHSQLNNDKRAKKAVFDLARSNVWQWFVTFTFSPKTGDRTDYNLIKGKLSKWLNNISNRYCNNELKYLCVPEQHKKIEDNGLRAWHFHALLANADVLHFYNSGVVQNGYTVYNIREYTLGFSTATPVVSTERVSRYITKYMTKSLVMHLKGMRRYLASNNLNRPIVEKVFIEKSDFDKLMKDKHIVWQSDKDYTVGLYNNTMMIREVDENEQ